jgi:hypothetical protein
MGSEEGSGKWEVGSGKWEVGRGQWEGGLRKGIRGMAIRLEQLTMAVAMSALDLGFLSLICIDSRDIERVMECVHSLLVSVRVCAPIQTPPRVWSFCPSFGGTYTRCCNNATI